MRRTRRIDPETGSYVMTDGAWVWDDTGFSQLYQAVMTKYGTVPGDRTIGCKAWDREKISSNTPAIITADMEAAAQPVIDNGTVDSFEVVYCEIDLSNPNRINYGWHWRVEGEDHYHDGNLAIGSS